MKDIIGESFLSIADIRITWEHFLKILKLELILIKNTDAWDITTHSLERLKLKSPKMPSEDVEQLDISHTTDENVNVT